MLGSVNENNATLTSYTQKDGNGGTALDPPSPGEAEKTISSVLHVVPRVQEKSYEESDNEEMDPTYASVNRQKDGDEAPSVPLKSQALLDRNSLDLNTQVPPPLPFKTKDGPTHVDVPQILASSSSKESLESGIGSQNPTLSRSASKDTVYSEPWDRKKTEENIQKSLSDKFSNGSGALSNPFPSDTSTDDSEKPLLSNSGSYTDSNLTLNSKKTNRIWPRAKYAMQQKSFVIPATSFFLITTYLSSSCLYRLLYLKETINFIDYIKSFQVWPLVTISSGLAVIGLCAFIYNYRNTESPAMRGLDDLSNVVSNNNLVHDITIYKKNNDLVKFKNKSYAGHREIPNFTYKKLKLVKERTLFNVCLSSLITVGSIYPLIKYLELGSEGFIKFFRFSSGKEELMISKLLVSENDAKLLSYFNNHNLKLIAFAAVLTVLAASLVCIFAYYRNEKTHIEPLKFDILVKDDVKARNNRYLKAVKGECDKISTEIETVVVRHYNDVDEEKKITVLAL